MILTKNLSRQYNLQLLAGSERPIQKKVSLSQEKLWLQKEKPSGECFALYSVRGDCFNLATQG